MVGKVVLCIAEQDARASKDRQGVPAAIVECRDVTPRILHPVWYMKGFDFKGGKGPASCVCQCEKALVQNQVCYHVREWKLVVLCCEGCPPRCRTKTVTTWKRGPEFEEPKILQVLDGRDMYAIGPTPDMCKIVCVFACGNLNFDEDYSPW